MTTTTETRTPAEEERTMRWIVEFDGGEAFPHNAAVACRLAANGKLVPETGEVFQRLAAALAAARTAPEPEPAAAPAREEL